MRKIIAIATLAILGFANAAQAFDNQDEASYNLAQVERHYTHSQVEEGEKPLTKEELTAIIWASKDFKDLSVDDKGEKAKLPEDETAKKVA